MKGIVVDTFMLGALVLEEPVSTSNTVVAVFNGAQVEVDELYKDSSWYKVTTATHCQGYVPKRFIAVKE